MPHKTPTCNSVATTYATPKVNTTQPHTALNRKRNPMLTPTKTTQTTTRKGVTKTKRGETTQKPKGVGRKEGEDEGRRQAPKGAGARAHVSKAVEKANRVLMAITAIEASDTGDAARTLLRAGGMTAPVAAIAFQGALAELTAGRFADQPARRWKLARAIARREVEFRGAEKTSDRIRILDSISRHLGVDEVNTKLEVTGRVHHTFEAAAAKIAKNGFDNPPVLETEARVVDAVEGGA